MKAEIIAIGDELVSGQRLDTNSRWLSQQLGLLGISTVRHTTVGDDLDGNVEAMQLAADRADVVICTGGLGPTLDDLTRQALAEAFNRPLRLDETSLERIRGMFRQRKRDMPERNRIQAFFPEGSQVIENPHGSAPGIDLSVDNDGGGSRFFALPGVPAEMKQMWEETLVPRLESVLADKRGSLRYHTVKVFGIGESDVEVRLPELIDRKRYPMVGITVSRATITLRVSGRAHSEGEFRELIGPTLKEIESALGDLVFGEGDDELQDVVLRMLNERRERLATLEIGAASWIGDWMLAANGNGAQFAGSLAFPSLPSAASWLLAQNGSAVSHRLPIGDQRADSSKIDDAGDAVSDELLTELVREVQQRFGCRLALLSGEYPCVDEMHLAARSFETYHAVADGDRVEILRHSMGGHPDVLGPRMAKTGLDAVRRVLADLRLR